MKIKLIEMVDDDLELVMAWRSNPDCYRFFRRQNAPLTWQEHINFWLNRKNREDFIICVNEEGRWRKVGNLNLTKLDTSTPEIGIIIGETSFHGKGVGSEVLKLALSTLREKGYKEARAEINKLNNSSIRIFTKNGFAKLKTNNDNEWLSFNIKF